MATSDGDVVSRQPARLLSVYTQVLGRDRRLGLIVVLLIALSGILEGVGLAAVIPLLRPVGEEAPEAGFEATIRRALDLSPLAFAYASLAAIIVVGATSSAARYLSDTRSLKLIMHVENRMKKQMVSAVLESSWDYASALRIGDITATILVAVPKISVGATAVARAAGNSLVAVSFISIALLISPYLTALTVVVGGLAAFGYRRLSHRATIESRRMATASEHLSTRVAETFGLQKFIRAVGSTSRFRESLAQSVDAYDLASLNAAANGAALRTALDLMGLAFVGVVLAFMLVRNHELPAVGLVFLAIFYRLAPRLTAIQESLHSARVGVGWIERWDRDLTATVAAAETAPSGSVPDFESGLEFDGVSFAYGTNPLVLEDVSFRVAPGRCVAIVGPSGSGKTTLLDLATGLLRPSKGRVLIDGTELSSVNPEAWRSKIGLVTQDSALLNASVRENVAWDGEDELGRVEGALSLANAAAFVNSMPAGIDSLIGDRGALISGGQRQRIALARALYREPVLLILDEATSALDGASEEAIQRSLEQLRGSVAMLLVAHRLSTIRFADDILVLSKGRIVERGSWDQLLEAGGQFAEMAARQALDAVAEDPPY